MKSEEAASAFLGAARARGLSPRTVEWYRMILGRFENEFSRLPGRPGMATIGRCGPSMDKPRNASGPRTRCRRSPPRGGEIRHWTVSSALF